MPPGDPERGAEYANICNGCHTLNQGGPDGFGPDLFGVFGARIASDPDYPYTEALMEMGARGAVWSEENLRLFLADPGAFAPGTAMPFYPPDQDDVTDAIAYLATLFPVEAN